MNTPETITYLLKPAELSLKGGNRPAFERVLKQNLTLRLKGTGARVSAANGRFYAHCPAGSAGEAEKVLERITGISGWAKAFVAPKTPGAVMAACVEAARECRERGAATFKLEARRTDKSFPLDSFRIREEGGSVVLEQVPGLKVDVHKPDAVIKVEIREKAYVYGMERRGMGGLPAGTAGRGLLLLSGGIDSPVAGCLMTARGMGLDAVYFHAYPYTSDEARQKVVKLAEIVGSYGMGVRLHTVSFTNVQTRLRERSPEAWRTVLLRMAMMECAEDLARIKRFKCLVSGESLSQVASQTIENIACIESRIGIPVLRPLIGLDKQEIIRMAKNLGSYETSILPYADCCILFSPPHPVLRGSAEEAGRLYEQQELSPLIAEALKNHAVEKCAYPR
jgi:thiamine biosynthesis protein ThiI